jgi:hypothetical protein
MISVDLLIYDESRKAARGSITLAGSGTDSQELEGPIKINTIQEEEENAERPVDEFVTKIDGAEDITIEGDLEIPGTTIEADAFGLIEGAVAGGGNAEFLAVTEGAWEGIGAGAFEGAAEGEIPIQLVQDITAPTDLDILGTTEDVKVTLSPIKIKVAEKNAKTEWKMIPRYQHVRKGHTRIHRNLRWSQWQNIKPHLGDGEEEEDTKSEPYWKEKDQEVGFVWLMKAPAEVRDNLNAGEIIESQEWYEGDPHTIVDLDGNTFGRWAIDKGILERGKKIRLHGERLYAMPGEEIWIELWWRSETDVLQGVHTGRRRNYRMAIQGVIDWGF